MTLGRYRALVLRWIKFSAVGWIGVLVQLSVLGLLGTAAAIHYLVATVLAVESAILHNFLWHERWTWGDRGLVGSPGRLSRLVRFNATTGLVSIAGNLVLMRLFVGELGLPLLVGNLASIACCALANYILSDRFVFLAPELRS